MSDIYFFLIVLLLFTPFIYGYMERIWVSIKNYKIKINKESFKGFKIIFLSDFHYSRYIPLRYIKKVVLKVNKLNPDLIILGGDYISYKDRFLEPLFNELKNLQAPYGTYAVLGNHDVAINKEKTLKWLKQANIKTLDNHSYWIEKDKERIKLGGVGDYLLDQQIIVNTIGDTTVDDYVILVSHNPDYMKNIIDYNIALVLSGHTHGGQITFFGLCAPVNPSNYKYLTGEKVVKNTKLIISNGLGCVGLPFRFFARPQIVVLDFT